METLIIRNSEWLRGKESKDSDNQSQMREGNRSCCLGLEAIRMGVAPEALEGKPDPREAREALPNCWMLIGGNENRFNSSDANYCININDNPEITDEERIEALRPIFLRNGVEIDWRPNE